MENKRGNFYVLFCPWRQKRTKRAPLEGETHGILGEILGKEVSATFSVSCLGCNFAREREDCPWMSFYFIFGLVPRLQLFAAAKRLPRGNLCTFLSLSREKYEKSAT
jgi:hypothetical protein